MIEVPGWVVLNFFTTFLLILLLIFQNKTSRLQSGRKYSAILICTIVLVAAESMGRIGEAYDLVEKLGEFGYYLIFVLDPIDILFAVSYVDCWMNNGNYKLRTYYKTAFQVFAGLNAIFVTLGILFNTNWFYHFENGIYYRGDYFMIRAVFMLIFIILLLAYVVIFRNNLISEYKNMILFLPLFSFIGAILQIFLSNIATTYAGISLGCVILFFFFQSRDINVDYLTGILNRRGLDIRMEEAVKNSQASGRDFTAIMMDLDNFKTINDNFGHEAGDKAIKLIANVLQFTFGEDAYIGRFGGDEFCVITQNTSNEEISKMINQVHDKLKKLTSKYGWGTEVDISCGYEIYKHDSHMSMREFVDDIDHLMYAEKEIHHSKCI